MIGLEKIKLKHSSNILINVTWEKEIDLFCVVIKYETEVDHILSALTTKGKNNKGDKKKFLHV